MKKGLISAAMLGLVALGLNAGTHQADAASKDWGSMHKTNRYFTVTNGNYKVYGNKDFDVKTSASRYKNSTVRVKGYYSHKNGNRYYSIYNNKNKWIGYVNWKAGKTTTSAWGTKLNGKKPIDTGNGNYTIYSNKDWKKSSSGSRYKGKLVRVDGYYHHFNGNRYYSMKYKGKWIGYMNRKGSYNKKTNGVYQFALDRANQVAKKYGAKIISSYRKDDLDYYGTGHGNGLAVDLSVGTAKKVNDSVWKKNMQIQNYIVSNYSASTEYTITDNRARGNYWNTDNYVPKSQLFKDPTASHLNHVCWHFVTPQNLFNF